MKVLQRFVPTILFVFALSIFAFAFADINTDYDKKADFSQYKSYSWIKVQTTNPLWQDRIKDSVDAELQAKGLRKVDDGGDLAITAVGSATNEKEYHTFYDGLSPWRWRGFGPETTTTSVTTYKVGTLVLDMYDAKDHRLIWRGTASDTLSDKPEKNEKKLEKTVSKMFEKYPPKREKE